MIVVCGRCGTSMVACAACVAAHAYPYHCPRGCVAHLPITPDIAGLCLVHRPAAGTLGAHVLGLDWDDRQRKHRMARRLLAPPTRPRRAYARAA